MLLKNPEAMQAVQSIFPAVHAQVTPSGPLQKVAVITASEIHWRTYPASLKPEDAVSRALKSCGVKAAWTQGQLGP